MLLTRLYLRNFRVYEDELDLVLPPGLVGIYGPNGAGKSTLLEAITWTLWGRARTGKDQIRSSGVGGDCITELEFEHEGHLYVVRRRITGINCTVRSEAICDGFGMAEGLADTRRYVQSVLGMDDVAFRASVFAEQKQLAAFSSQAPAERRRLVLQLLGITPLDGARDAARKDARDKEAQLTQLRGMLPDLDVLAVAVADAEAAAGAAEADAAAERLAADTRAAAEAAARTTWESLDRGRQAYDALVIRGTAARKELDREVEAVAALTAELEGLSTAAVELQAAQTAASGLAEEREHLLAVRGLLDARRRLDAASLAFAPEPPPDEPLAEAVAAQVAEATAAGERRAALDGELAAATTSVERAEQQLQRAGSLSAEADCPLCGQALGEAWASVQAHRQDELASARERVTLLQDQRAKAAAAAQAATAAATDATRAHQQAEQARRAWELARVAHDAAAQASEEAAAGVPAAESGLTLDELDCLVGTVGVGVADREQAAATVARLRGRLERRPQVEQSLVEARARCDTARAEVEGLREELRALEFDPAALAAAAATLTEATQVARAAADVAHGAEVRAATARSHAEGEAKRLADGRAQHQRLADLDAEVRHVSRVAALLSEFRNTVVASVGPRLAAQAAELFGELTDREYDELQVDPETYELQISDHGVTYGLDRFSGSEIDLANLALRVAISEHVRFQSGGTVGLLVLDEVFGPLDEDRKARMLQALEQLRGRFRQVLVVTHDASIKEQLPNAVEVAKRPGRRATARVLA